LRVRWICFAILFFINAGYFLLTPPFQAPDEFAHFRRIEQLSEGKIRGKIQNAQSGDDLPQVMSEINSFSDLPFRPDNKITLERLKKNFALSGEISKNDSVFAAFPNTSLYPPISYLPQIVGAIIGRHLHFSILTTYYLERFFCSFFVLLSALVLFGLARRHGISWPIFFVGFVTPMGFFLVNSTSADAVIILLSVAFGVFTAIASKESRKIWWSFSLLSVTLLSICKFVYLPLSVVALPGIIRAGCFKRREKYFFGVLFFLLPLTTATIWLAYTSKVYIPLKAGIDPGESLKYLFSHLFEMVPALVVDVLRELKETFRSAIGILGWLDTPLPRFTYQIYFVVGLFLLFTKSKVEGEKKDWVAALSFAGAYFGSLLFIYLSLYLSWNLPGSIRLEGIQGRYFLPLVVAFAFSPFRFALSAKAYRYGSVAAFNLILFVHIGALLGLYHRYWTV
jgi:uncharacterized membrane protein